MPSIMLNYMMTMINIFIFDIFLTTFMMKNDSNDNDDGNSSDTDECQQADNRIVVFGMQDLAEEKICILKFPIEPIQLT